jgi:ComF family protein
LGPHVDPNAGCSLCLRESFAFDAAYRLGSYDGLLRELILRAKFHGPALAEYLADLWCDVAAEPLRNAGCDVVVPVPLHWRRRLWRGYNGAEAVAQVLAERLGLPCHAAALKRIRSTPVQPGHSWTQRRVNVRGAFRASRWADLRGRRVLLVDDVMTSGSTASASSVALKQAGAVHLVVAVLARAGLSS